LDVAITITVNNYAGSIQVADCNVLKRWGYEGGVIQIQIKQRIGVTYHPASQLLMEY
jgi:hypothetical protein